MPKQAKRFYEFGPFRLDLEECLLVREGESVSLPPKVFETLKVLVENNGHVLKKEDLMTKIWPDSFVEESNLAQNISALRKVLGETAGGQKYIETLTKRGYRFIAPVKEILEEPPELNRPSPVEVVSAPRFDQAFATQQKETGADWLMSEGDDEAAMAGSSLTAQREIGVRSDAVTDAVVVKHPQPAPAGAASITSVVVAPTVRRGPISKPGWLAASVVVMALLAGFAYFTRSRKEIIPAKRARTLAVLPFRNLKPDQDTDFLSFSLADAIITKLGYVGEIVVRPSSYIEKYRNQIIEPDKVAEALKVNTLLTGTYLREGDELEINVQLFDVSTTSALWSDTIRLKSEKLITVQDQIVQPIIKALRLNLNPAEAQRLQKDAPTNPQAYEYFLRGVALYAENNFRLALQMLDKAIAIDPGFAQAYANRGRAWNASGSFDFAGREAYRKAQADFDKALSLNPNLVEALIYKANLLTDTGRVEQAVPLLREAIDAHPTHAEAHWELGYAYRFAGMLKEAIAEGERARQFDPEVKITTSAFNSYIYDGQYQQFLDRLPLREDNAFIIFYRGLGRYYLGDRKSAAADFDRAFALDASLYTQAGRALSYELAGRKDEGLELLRNTEKRIEASGVNDAEGIYKLAQAYAVLGDKAASLRVLRRSIAGGFFCYPYFTTDPLLQNLRGESEYASLMETARKRHEEFRQKFF